MSVISLVSATGSPGVTTTSLGLLMYWPRDVLLVDVDRDAGQAVLAGFLQGQDAGGRGLTALAAAHREHRPFNLLAQTFPLVDDPAVRRLFLPGFAHPAAAALFTPVWNEFGSALREAAGGFDILLDAGRIGVGLPESLIELTDLIVVVVRSQLRSLAALGGVLGPLADRAGMLGTRIALLVVGPGRPYDSSDIVQQFGHPVLATLAWDPAGAMVLSDGEPARRFERTALGRSLQDASGALSRATNLERVP